LTKTEIAITNVINIKVIIIITTIAAIDHRHQHRLHRLQIETTPSTNMAYSRPKTIVQEETEWAAAVVEVIAGVD
jgi:hypothetical protein